MQRRIACLVIPEFLTDVCVRANPSLAGRAIAIADGVSRREIVARNRAAAAVALGMTPKQARSACPRLVVIAREEQNEREAVGELLEALECCGPDIEALTPGICFLDVTGVADGETQTLGTAMAQVHALGFAATAGIADDKFTARCAALTGGGCSIVPSGGSAAFLAVLPISLLPLAAGDEERFDLLGLRVLGQIAALATAPLAARFGERARHYAALARGEDAEPLFPHRAQTVYEDRFAFESTVTQLEPLFFALRGCVGNVAGRLAGAAAVCDRVDVIVILDATNLDAMRKEDGAMPTVFTIPVKLAEPTSSPVVIFNLARVALEAQERLGPVEAIIVRAMACGQPPPQLGLFDGARGSRGAALAATLARLHAALAQDDVVTVVAQRERSRLPERMQRALPVSSPQQFAPPKRAIAQAPPAWAPALRLIDPPRSMRAPHVQATYAGPFRLSESWWAGAVERDYYQLRDVDGALVLAFHDIREGSWYVQGVFD